MARHYRFEVRGSGEFPWDMLRYDRVYPTTEPTPDRWASLGWKVVDAEDAIWSWV